jgi:hypothetical protein
MDAQRVDCVAMGALLVYNPQLGKRVSCLGFEV